MVRTVRHAADGPREHWDRHLTLQLSAPDPAALRRVARVRIGDYAVDLDHGQGVAHHPSHSDTLYSFERHKAVHLFLELYRPEAVAGASHRAELTLSGGPAFAIPIGTVEEAPGGDPLHSDLLTGSGGRGRTLLVRAAEPFHLIRQQVKWGRFAERTEAFPPGEHRIAIPPAFADYLGVCVTTRAMTGGVEHKHMILGHIGMGSGRHAVDGGDGRLHHPKTPEPYAYKALVALARDAGEGARIAALAEDFDEVELFHPWGGDAAGWTRGWRVPVRTTSVGPRAEADLVSWDGQGEPPRGRPFTMLFLADAASPDFPDRVLAAARAARHLPDAAPFWDRAFLTARRGALDPGAHGEVMPRHGIAFARAVATDPVKAIARDRRRLLLRNSPCADCPAKPACDNILPLPYPEQGGMPGFVADGDCALSPLLKQPAAGD